jgi:hypothetical protein
MMTDPSRPDDARSRCAQCGAPFRCGMQSGDPNCWCASLPALPLERLRAGALCLCPACLAKMTREPQANFRPS